MSNLSQTRSPLTFYERQILEMRWRGKWKIRGIARYLKRSPSIISRELRRNSHPSGKYTAAYAQKKADKCSHRTNKRKLDKDFMLNLYVSEKLENGWSPEQIAGRLKRESLSWLLGKTISHESIYQYIYENPKGRYLYQYLRYKNAPRRQKQHSRKTRKAPILERVFISERPEIINQKARFGDWESDSAQFRKQKAGLSVQHERKSLSVLLHKLQDRSAKETREALIASIESLPDYDLIKSFTFDNGGENACHGSIRDNYRVATYFCEPYKAWQKGGVENSIGLLRQYLPRSTDLSTIDNEKLIKIQEKLNDRPRKKLGYLTPNEVINKYLTDPKSVA